MTDYGRWLPVRLAAAGGTLLLLAACTTNPGEDRLGKFLVAPGKYRLYDCEQLSRMAASYTVRERELRDVKAKAEAAPGGGFVSAIAYDAEYSQVRGNLDELRREAAEKKCELARSPAPGSTLGAGRRVLR